MSTIREWLREAQFDSKHGKIVFQNVTDDAYCPGWASDDEIGVSEVVSWKHPILDLEFDASFGSPQCPRFIAKDKKALYFPGQYDGATFLVVIRCDLSYYMNHPTPYPGS